MVVWGFSASEACILRCFPLRLRKEGLEILPVTQRVQKRVAEEGQEARPQVLLMMHGGMGFQEGRTLRGFVIAPGSGPAGSQVADGRQLRNGLLPVSRFQ